MSIDKDPMYRVIPESSRPLKRAEALARDTLLKRHGSRVEATVNDIHDFLLLKS